MRGRGRRVYAPSIVYATPADTISLHLGYPDPRTFPSRAIQAALDAELEQSPAIALQYCEEAGDPDLRASLVRIGDELASRRPVTKSEVLITQGTTEAIALICQSLLVPGDTVLVERPTYVWGIRMFKSFGARVKGVATSRDGIVPAALADTLKQLRQKGIRPRLLYVMPDFQNPTGQSMPFRARTELLQVAVEYDLNILEDTPYRDLYFESAPAPRLFDLDRAGVVALAQSFSKTIGPGVRLGWIIWKAAQIDRLAKLKQTGACTLISRAVARYLQTSSFSITLSRARELYRDKRNAMEAALAAEMPKTVSWDRPSGGFYYWLRLPSGLDASTVCRMAADRKVLTLDGTSCFPDRYRFPALRVSFSYESADRIAIGIARLGEAIRAASR